MPGAPDNLQEFVEALEKAGELKRISIPINPVLEITEIADRCVKGGGPALLFEKPVGSRFPLLINAFASWKRVHLAFGVEDIEELAEQIRELIHLTPPLSLADKLRVLSRLNRLRSALPRRVKSGPCQEVVMDPPNLLELPILQCWPQDGGRYITLPLVITQDPKTGRRNVGMYRIQVFDATTTAMHWQIHKVGPRHFEAHSQEKRRMEVAVVLGGDPVTIYTATAPLPEGVDEILFSGFLRRKPVELVKCKTVNLEVPAEADFVIEGYLDPEERCLEGPFGDHTGFYSLADYYPVFHVTCITYRRNPIYPTTIVGRPPMEDGWLGKITERLFLPLIQLQLPEVVDINLPVETVFHNLAIVSIRKKYPGHAYKVMHALWGMGQMSLCKCIIVVDEECNVHNLQEVMWRVGNAVDPERDIQFVRGPVDVLDHSARFPAFGSKMGIDATRKWKEEGFNREWPEEIVMSPEVKRRIDELWPQLGIDLPGFQAQKWGI